MENRMVAEISSLEEAYTGLFELASKYRTALQSIASMSDDKTAARIAQEVLGE